MNHGEETKTTLFTREEWIVKVFGDVFPENVDLSQDRQVLDTLLFEGIRQIATENVKGNEKGTDRPSPKEDDPEVLMLSNRITQDFSGNPAREHPFRSEPSTSVLSDNPENRTPLGGKAPESVLEDPKPSPVAKKNSWRDEEPADDPVTSPLPKKGKNDQRSLFFPIIIGILIGVGLAMIILFAGIWFIRSHQPMIRTSRANPMKNMTPGSMSTARPGLSSQVMHTPPVRPSGGNDWLNHVAPSR